METDKAVLEAESFYEGTLLKVLVKEGQTVPVNAAVAYVGQPGEAVPAAPPPVAAAPAPAVSAPAAPAAPSPAPAPAQPAVTAAPMAAPPPVPTPPAPAAPQRLVISPRARALARRCAIDPSRIRGSGPNGRIVNRDVEAYLAERGYEALRISPAAKRLAMKEQVDVLTVRGTGTSGRIMMHDVERVMAERPRRMSKMRQTIARRLSQSFAEIPHFYVTVAVDMTDLMAYRKELKERGLGYTVTDFILEAVVLTLQEFPIVNSVTDGATVRWRASVDLGMAVSLDDGLVVPVIRNAGELSMPELRDQARVLAAKAREGKLLPDEMAGSSLTVSNMGMMNVQNFHAIINPGEAAILAVASTVEMPVVRNGKIVVRAMMNITLSCDHRIVDGAVGAAFVNAIKGKLEDPELWKSLT
jgi:pyruvate dehydrogenase E2 component (dihydrolipoamide acetyltransferase)